MGGCVASVMHSRHKASICPHPVIEQNKGILSRAYNVPVGKASDTCSAIYRSEVTAPLDYDQFYKEYYNGNLVVEMDKMCRKFNEKDAMGYRPLEKIEKTTIKDDKGRAKKWEYMCFKDAVRLSYTEVWSKVLAVGIALQNMGVKAGDRVGIYEDTRMEWMVTCYGLWTIGATGVTVYANLGQDALAYAIKESELKFIVCNGSLAQNIASVCNDAHIDVPTVIYIDSLKGELKTPHHSWAELVDAAKKEVVPDRKYHISKPDDIALIMYTSGTTGDPKGVVMSHGNLFAAVRIVRERMNIFFPTGKSGTYMAYLPLAHILEFAAENAFFQSGWFVAYGNPRTLTNVSAKPHGDLQEFKPHILIGVPRVYDTIKKVIEERIPAGLKRRIFHQAFEERWKCLKEGKDTPYYNSQVFANVRQVLGGQVEAMLSGGAPLSAKSQQFMIVVSGATLVQGYGLTETCAAIATQLPWELKLEESGAIFNAVEVKLRDTSDWLHTNNPPQGEILVRGPGITKGYYRQPEKTKESWTEDGWFATGDVGEFTKDLNNLKIVGRVKALAKTAHGEYIAMETLEAIYVTNELCLANGVCLLVDSQKSFICALVLTDEKKATKFAQENKISGSWPDLLKKPEFHAAAAESLAATAKKNGRRPFEFVKKVRVLDDEWTPENGILTAAQKLKRREVDKQYASVIKELFEEGDANSF